MMTSIIALTSAAVFTGFTVEWAQRKCELWAARGTETSDNTPFCDVAQRRTPSG